MYINPYSAICLVFSEKYSINKKNKPDKQVTNTAKSTVVKP